MTKTYLAAAMLAVAAPGMAVAEWKFEGSSIVGAGNHGLRSGAYGIVTATGTHTTSFDNGFKGSASATLTARSFQRQAEYQESDYLTFNLGLDMGSAGKLSIGNQRRLGQRPWADGILFNHGSASVFPTAQLPLRRVDDTFVLIEDGQRKKTRPLAVIRYENAQGPLSYFVNLNPFDRYRGGFRGDDLLDETPRIEARMAVKTGFGTYGAMANDLRDYSLSAEYAVAPDTKLELFHEWRDSNRSVKRDAVILNYRRPPSEPGLFRGLIAGYYETPVSRTGLLGVTFGGQDWQLMLAADQAEGRDANFAIEGNYKLAPNMTLYAALDGGHDLFEGHDSFRAPPISAPARGRAAEIALKIDF